ncbi:hypothetical protein MTO96_035434 [Rhipicephalus appendiculatus]
MVGKTSLAGVATLTVVMLVVLCVTEIQACDNASCHSRCVRDGGSSGYCNGPVCQCRKNYRRSVDSHLDTWPKHAKRSVDSHA